MFSFIYSPIVSLYRSLSTHNTGEVFVSKKVMSAIENSKDKDELLNKLYNLK